MSSIVSSESVQELLDKEVLTFTLFPKFPLELRLMVWKEALPGPRMIGFLAKGSDESSATITGKTFQRPAPSDPVILFVNHESRSVSLSTYQLAFHHRLPKPVYFNFSEDSVFFPNVRGLLAFTLGYLKAAKRLQMVKEVFAENQAMKKIIVGCRTGLIWNPSLEIIRTLVCTQFKTLSSLILGAGDINHTSGGPSLTNTSKMYLDKYKALLAKYNVDYPRREVSESEVTVMESAELLGMCDSKVIRLRDILWAGVRN
ncbi:hypothetical protein BKA61DRAFT_569890 [Leptodontidium sp. MPI-SDFR-AT-0119]|nr:hypothetical protein BKA61DRAFT_569890 [Leptodontidium sp. MPI-SDFR-AT-0119]